MLDDAIRSIRQLFLLSLVVLAVWALGWPAARATLTRFQEVRQLHAWLLLRDRLDAIDDREALLVSPLGEAVTHETIWREGAGPQGGEYLDDVRLQVRATWPQEEDLAFELVPFADSAEALAGRPLARVYRIASPGELLPLGDYLAVVLQSPPAIRVIAPSEVVVRPKARLGVRAIEAAAREGDHPIAWDALVPALEREGFAGRPSQLPLDHRAVLSISAAADPRVRKVGVLGVDLDLAQFISGVGMILAAIGFAMLGPLLALQAAKGQPHEQAWVFAIPPQARLGPRLVAGAARLVLAAWAASPLAILIVQSIGAPDLSGLSSWLGEARLVGALGLCFASGVFLSVARALGKIGRGAAA